MRPRTFRWTVAAVAVAALLWIADATLRTQVFGDGTFVRQLFMPPPDVLLGRLPLMAFGVITLLSLRGIKLLQDAREEAVQERKQLRLLYDHTSDAIVFLDRDLRLIYLNKAAERLGGKRLAEAIGWPCHQALLHSDEPCHGCQAAEVFRTAEPRSATKYEVLPTGQENWLEQRWFPVLGAKGEVEAVLEVARDITERKLVERELDVCRHRVDEMRRKTAE